MAQERPAITLSEALGIPQQEMDALLDSAITEFGDKQCTIDEVIRFLLKGHGLNSSDAPKAAAIGYMAALEKLRSLRAIIPAKELGLDREDGLLIEGQLMVDFIEGA
jgi:hypothetical protein